MADSGVLNRDDAQALPRATERSVADTAAFDGVLLVDKPAGMTSHDVVDAVRRRFRFDKVGHGGTLDPQATGLLIVMVGRGTKLANTFMAGDKTYEGTLRLGVATDTQDADGVPLREGDWHAVTREALAAEMQRWLGDRWQTPPMVSAAKRNGVPLYKLARKGQVVERKPKLIHLYVFELLAFEPPRAVFRLRCTKGVYVRTLCADIGDALGCGGHLEQLRRLQSGGFRLEDAIGLDALLQLDRARLRERLIPMHRLLAPAAPPS